MLLPSPSTSITIRALLFGAGQNGTAQLRGGWHQPEATFTWSAGTLSIVNVPIPPGLGDLRLVLWVMGFRAGGLPQRLYVTAGVAAFPTEVIDAQTVIEFIVPGEHVRGLDAVEVVLHHPDAASPLALGVGSDSRRLAIALEKIEVARVPSPAPFEPVHCPPIPLEKWSGSKHDCDLVRDRTALTPSALLNSFESLGTNCEFGLVQRVFDAEPLGLLRFAGLPYSQLVRGISTGFEGIDTADQISCRADRSDDVAEWIVRCHRFDMEYHSHRRANHMTAETLLREQLRTLSFRRAKLLDILASGEKLFAVYRPQGMSVAQALPLYRAIQDRGPGALLFASTETNLAPGSVVALGPRLFCGSLSNDRYGPDRMPVDNRTWVTVQAATQWISICCNAYKLWRELTAANTASMSKPT